MPRKLISRPALLLGAALLALAGGCLPPWDYARHEREQEGYRQRMNVSYPAFDEAEYVPFQKTGTGVIVGLVGYKTRKGIYAAPPGTGESVSPRDPHLWGGKRVWSWTWSSVPAQEHSYSGTSVTVIAGRTVPVVVCNDWYNSTTRCGWVQEPRP